jgi:hypothetical protein
MKNSMSVSSRIVVLVAAGVAIVLLAASPVISQQNIRIFGTLSDGRAIPLVANSSGALSTTGGGGSGGAAQADNTALGDLTGAGALYDTTPSAVTDGNVGAFRMDSDRVLFMKQVSGTRFTVNVDQINGTTPVTAICDNATLLSTVAVDVSSAGNNQLVAGDGVKLTYVCGFDLLPTAAVDFQWVYGDDASCTTTETNIGGVQALTNTNGPNTPNTGAVQFKVPAGKFLCAELGTAVATRGYLTYVQQ